MHIFISGASGRNGRLVLQEALQKGHTVTALVRNPDSLTPHLSLTTVQGNPSSLDDVYKALSTPAYPSAVITTLNPRRVTENPWSPLSPDSPPDLLESTARVLLAAVARIPDHHQRPKIVVNSSQGVGSSWPKMSFITRMLMHHSTMRLTIKDHDNMDILVRNSGLVFVLARPTRLAEGPSNHVKVLSDEGPGVGVAASITRESVAKWLVEAAETNKWDGTSPVLIN